METVVVNCWPQSQDCLGCKFATLTHDVEKYGSCAYICEKNTETNGCGYCPDREEQEVSAKKEES